MMCLLLVAVISGVVLNVFPSDTTSETTWLIFWVECANISDHDVRCK